jgi:hypothetical protein
MEVNVKYAGMNLTPEDIKLIENSNSEIVDIKAFLSFTKDSKVLEKIALHKTSEGKTIDLRTPITNLQALILDLPEAEQQRILTKRDTVRSLLTKITNNRRVAFGEYDKRVTKTDTLLVSKKAELMEYFGRMFKPKDVYQIIREEWKNNEITLVHLQDFYKENYEAISTAIEKHKNDYPNMRLVSKTSRLEELISAYHKAKRKYEATNNREDGKFAMTIIAEIRKESEGDVLTINGNMNIQHNVNVQVKTELLRSINLKEIILGRVAAKMRIPSIKLVEDLNKSFYAKYNNLINNGEYVDFEEVTKYPSDGAYDFVAIKNINEQREQQQEIDKRQQRIEAANSSKVDENKQRLLDKIRALTEGNNKSEINAVKNTL